MLLQTNQDVFPFEDRWWVVRFVMRHANPPWFWLLERAHHAGRPSERTSAHLVELLEQLTVVPVVDHGLTDEEQSVFDQVVERLGYEPEGDVLTNMLVMIGVGLGVTEIVEELR